METKVNHIGSIVKELMYQKKISTHVLANQIGIHPNNLRRILEKTVFSQKRMQQLSEALDHNLLVYLPQPKTTIIESEADEKDIKIVELEKENKRLSEENTNLKLIVELFQKK